MNYGFIGFGKLARAIYQGLKDEPIDFAYVSRENDFTEIRSYKTIKELAAFADVIWICVKPQDVEPVLRELRAASLGNKMIVSPVAGKSLKYIEGFLGADTTIARIMPNLATAYGQSVTAYADNSEREITDQIKTHLEKLGKLVEIEERHFDLFTAIFGSGPAFLLEILSVFKWKAGEMGLPESQANELLIQLVRGTISYFEANPQKSIPELVDQIASRGGTTEAGLRSFKENKMELLIGSMIEAARKRSEELGS